MNNDNAAAMYYRISVYKAQYCNTGGVAINYVMRMRLRIAQLRRDVV